MMQPSVLIVEDEAVVAEDLAQKVQALGYRVIALTSTGENALELAQEQHPNLVLLDIKLAGKLDGIETAGSGYGFKDGLRRLLQNNFEID